MEVKNIHSKETLPSVELMKI